MTDDTVDRHVPADGFELVDDIDDLNERLSAPVPEGMAVPDDVHNVCQCGATVGKNPEEPDDRGTDCGGQADNE
jgi:hypothetical protein